MRCPPDFNSSSCASSDGWKRKRISPGGRVAALADRMRATVGVVAAGVHDPFVGGSIGNVVGFDDGQGVHIGANGNHRAAFAQPGHDAGFGDAGLHLKADVVQDGGDGVRSANLAEAEFGMGVEVAPPLGELFGKRLRLVEHGVLLGAVAPSAGHAGQW
jgi:hypothetical protein